MAEIEEFRSTCPPPVFVMSTLPVVEVPPSTEELASDKLLSSAGTEVPDWPVMINENAWDSEGSRDAPLWATVIV